MGKHSNSSENVQVVVRLRPLSDKEKKAGHTQTTTADLSSNNISVQIPDTGEVKSWTFDQVFTDIFTQRDIYLQVAHPVVESVIQGYNATIFCYGQSGTGKTFTMTGVLDKPELLGIIPNALNHIFSVVNAVDQTKKKYSVQVSYVELYNGKCRDLLVENKLNLEIKENSQKIFYVKDLSMWDVTDANGALKLMEQGLKNREVKATELNSDSSRSHSIYAVHIKCHDIERDVRTESKLNLVDLAGSERQSKTMAQGETLKEGSNINLSLTALGSVIDCVVKGKPHIPFRSSPLTMLLKDALGGGSRTLLFGNVGPAEHNAQETISTLRFVDRAKQIKNKPKVQMDAKDQRIMELMEENKELRRRLGMVEGSESDEDEDVEDIDETQDPPTMTKKQTELKAVKKEASSSKSWDSEITQLKRRIDELEVSLETAERENQQMQEDFEAALCKERSKKQHDEEMESETIRSQESFRVDMSLAQAERNDAMARIKELLDVSWDALQATFTTKEKQEWQANMMNPEQSAQRMGPSYPSDVLIGLRILRDNAAGISRKKSSKTVNSNSGTTAETSMSTSTNAVPTATPTSNTKNNDSSVPSATNSAAIEQELRRELENAVQSLECQRALVAKSKDSLDARLEENNRLKEHVNAMRAELKKTKEQHVVELQEAQDKLVLQTNKRIEKLVLTHQQQLAKQQRQIEKLQEKLKRNKEKYQSLEQEYDVKILENEQLLRDYESMKVETMKKMKDWGMFSAINNKQGGGGPGDQQDIKKGPNTAVVIPTYLPTIDSSSTRTVVTQPFQQQPTSTTNDPLDSTQMRVPHPPPSMFSRNFLDIRK